MQPFDKFLTPNTIICEMSTNEIPSQTSYQFLQWDSWIFENTSKLQCWCEESYQGD